MKCIALPNYQVRGRGLRLHYFFVIMVKPLMAYWFDRRKSAVELPEFQARHGDCGNGKTRLRRELKPNEE